MPLLVLPFPKAPKNLVRNKGNRRWLPGNPPVYPCTSRKRAEQLGTGTATILLVRHASHADVGTVLSGRTAGGGLTGSGREQAAVLSRVLAGILAASPLAIVHTSPAQRARETADAIAAPHRDLAVTPVAALDEIDFGAWAGRSFTDLSGDPQWQRWNMARAVAETPGGESMAAVQERAWRHIERMARAHGGAAIVMVSHCDLIRAVVARVLGLSLDAILRFAVDPASITRVAVGRWGAELQSLNETPWRSGI